MKPQPAEPKSSTVYGAVANKADYQFCPILGDVDLDSAAKLMIFRAEVPVFGGSDRCDFAIFDTESGLGQRVVEKMRSAKTFDATLVFGGSMDTKRTYRCEFVNVEPIALAWTEKSAHTEIRFQLRLTSPPSKQ